MSPAHERGTAYGIFYTGYGILWFLGSAFMGCLYDHSISGLVAFSVIAQLIAIPLVFIAAQRHSHGH
jgi:predicted MFS family arabinose efflux permease